MECVNTQKKKKNPPTTNLLRPNSRRHGNLGERTNKRTNWAFALSTQYNLTMKPNDLQAPSTTQLERRFARTIAAWMVRATDLRDKRAIALTVREWTPEARRLVEVYVMALATAQASCAEMQN